MQFNMKSFYWRIIGSVLVTCNLAFLSCTSITLKAPEFTDHIPSQWSDEAIIMLHDSVNLTLKVVRDSTYLYDQHISWYKINKPSPKLMQTLELYDSEFIERKPNIKITAIYKNGKSKYICLSKRLRLSDNMHYMFALWVNKTSVFKNTFEIPDYSNLKYLRIAVKRKYKRPEFLDRQVIRSKYHTVHKFITFTYPKNSKFNINVLNPEKLDITTSVIRKKDQKCFIIKGKNIHKINDYSNCKFPEQWYAALYYSLPPIDTDSYSWKQLGDYYLNLITESLEKCSVIDSLANLAIFLNKDNIIQECFDYVKNTIRYYGSWEKEFSFVPRSPDSVLAKGYGDCKEMATVLTLLLRKHDVEAWQVLVSTPGNFQYRNEFPTLGSFNHMIVAVRESSGQIRYLDPTHKQYTFFSSYYSLINQKILLLKEGESEIGVVSPHSSYENNIITSSHVILSPDKKKWQIQGEIQFSGEISSHVYMKIKNSTKDEDYKQLYTLLQDGFNIFPKEVNVKELAHKKTTLSFITDYTESIISAPSRGIIFSTPCLYTPQFKFSDLSYDGDRYLSKINQTDIWNVPRKFKKGNFIDLGNRFAEGTWRKSKNKIIREYSCNFSHIKEIDKNQLQTFFTERKDFARGTIWID